MIVRMIIGMAVSIAGGLLMGRAARDHDWLGVILALVVSIYVALAHSTDLRWNAP